MHTHMIIRIHISTHAMTHYCFRASGHVWLSFAQNISSGATIVGPVPVRHTGVRKAFAGQFLAAASFEGARMVVSFLPAAGIMAGAMLLPSAQPYS